MTNVKRFFHILFREGLFWGILCWLVLITIGILFGLQAFGLSFLATILANTETRLRLGLY